MEFNYRVYRILITVFTSRSELKRNFRSNGSFRVHWNPSWIMIDRDLQIALNH